MELPRTLGAFPYRRVRLVCPWCPRRQGDYDTERLIARLGARASLEDVLAALVTGCRWPKAWHSQGPEQVCALVQGPVRRPRRQAAARPGRLMPGGINPGNRAHPGSRADPGKEPLTTSAQG